MLAKLAIKSKEAGFLYPTSLLFLSVKNLIF